MTNKKWKVNKPLKQDRGEKWGDEGEKEVEDVRRGRWEWDMTTQRRHRGDENLSFQVHQIFSSPPSVFKSHASPARIFTVTKGYLNTRIALCFSVCVCVCFFASTPDIDILYYYVFQAVSDALEKLHQQWVQIQFSQKLESSGKLLLPSLFFPPLTQATSVT